MIFVMFCAALAIAYRQGAFRKHEEVLRAECQKLMGRKGRASVNACLTAKKVNERAH